MRMPSRFVLSEVNGRAAQPTQQKPNGYRIHCGKCLRIAGMRTWNVDGKLGVCAIGFLILPPHEFRTCHALEEVHRVLHGRPQVADGRPVVALRPVGFAVQLDQLQADDCPKYLTKHLGFALQESRVFKQPGMGLGAQVKGVKVLLEALDKVWW